MEILTKEETIEAYLEAKRTGILEYVDFSNSYFPTGFSLNSYNNYNYTMVIAMIGKKYNLNKKGKNSNYHNGIAYLANELNISKRKVKSLRKKFKVLGGYQFKIPYEIADIVELIIEILKQHEENNGMKDFVSQHRGEMYRDILIGEQKDAIDISVEETGDNDITEIQGYLDKLTEKCGI